MYSTLVATLLLTLGCVYADRVPVMMWSNDESVNFPPVLAGHSVSTADFEKNYVEQLGGANKNLVIFVQNKLSIADISHYANIYGYEDEEDSAFQNVKTLMTELTSSHLPNVVSPMSVFDGDKNRKARTVEAPYDLEELVTSGDLGLVLVKLSDVDAAQYQKSLRDNDKIIGDVVRQLEAHGVKYTGLYTALSYSNKVPTGAQDFVVIKSASSGRQLLAAAGSSNSNTTNGTFSVGDSILLYLGGLSISNSSSYKDAQPVDLEKMSVDKNASDCSGNNTSSNNNNDNNNNNNSSCVMKLTYDSKEPVDGLTFTFSFSQSSGLDVGYWYISSLQMTYVNQSGGSDTLTVDLNTDQIGSWSPMNYSFSCNEPYALTSKNKTEKAGGVYVFFRRLQVQAFGGLTKGGGFGYYNDCEAFFSAGIWMALICIAVMIGILVFGLYMLCQITTMDRFDDPKGKTIIVNQGAD